MGKKMDLETFNEILFSAFKELSPKALHDLYVMELNTAYGIKIQCMEKVINDLNEGLPYHENLQEVNNVDSNLDRLHEKIVQLEKEHPEIKEVDNED